MSAGRTGRPPSTMPVLAAWSETVSTAFRVAFVAGSTCWIRASMLATAGATKSVAEVQGLRNFAWMLLCLYVPPSENSTSSIDSAR